MKTLAVPMIVLALAGCGGPGNMKPSGGTGAGSGGAGSGKAEGHLPGLRYPIEDLYRSYTNQAIEYGRRREKMGKILAKARPESYADNERVYAFYTSGRENLLSAVREAYAEVTSPSADIVREIRSRRPEGVALPVADQKAVAWLSWLEGNWDKPGAVPPEVPPDFRTAYPPRRSLGRGP